MAALKPTDFLSLPNLGKVLPKMLKNPIAWDTFVDAASNVADDLPDSNKDKHTLQAIYTGDPLKRIDPIILGKVLVEFVEIVLDGWKQDSDDETADQMKAALPLFIEMSTTIPHVNPSTNYKAAFRGTEFADSKLIPFVRKSKPTDWKRTKLAGDDYMVYVGPLKNGFVYKPHRSVQSWSVSDKAAAGFGSSIVTVPIDDTFFFDPKFTGKYGFKHEKETVHFGKNPMKVALMMDRDEYNNIRRYGSTYNLGSDRLGDLDESSGSNEIQDDEGTLTIPGI